MSHVSTNLHLHVSKHTHCFNFQKLQAAKKKEFMGDHMDMSASRKAMEILNKPAVKAKIEQLLTEGELRPENRVLVRR